MMQRLFLTLLFFVHLISSATELANDARFAPGAKISADGDGISFLVMLDGKTVFENYPTGNAPTTGSELASGTKSFSGVLALCAIEDGLLTLDEKLSDTITEWKSDPVRRQITYRHLLSLTSGIEGGKIGRVPSYKDSIKAKAGSAPGTVFNYGPSPFQIFGEALSRKLAARGDTVENYLETKILSPLKITPTGWRKDGDRQPHLPSGAKLSARNWAKFGEMIRLDGAGVLPPGKISELFNGTTANPGYGLTWWLPAKGQMGVNAAHKRSQLPDGFPKDVYVAAGLGGQVLLVVPSLNLVAVRQAPVRVRKNDFNQAEWITALLQPLLNSSAEKKSALRN